MGANRSRCGCRPLIGGILRCTTVEIRYAGSVRSTIKNDLGGVTTAISDPKTKRDTHLPSLQLASHCLGFLSSRTYSYIRGGRSRVRKVVWNHKSWAQLSPTRVASFTHRYYRTYCLLSYIIVLMDGATTGIATNRTINHATSLDGWGDMVEQTTISQKQVATVADVRERI